MAPPAVPAARSGGSAGNKPNNRKPVVVPAIPLPYIQHQPKPAPAASATPTKSGPKEKLTISPSDEKQTARSPARSTASITIPPSAATVNGELADKLDSLEVKGIAQKTDAEPTAVTQATEHSVGGGASTSASSGNYSTLYVCVFVDIF